MYMFMTVGVSYTACDTVEGKYQPEVGRKMQDYKRGVGYVALYHCARNCSHKIQ